MHSFGNIESSDDKMYSNLLNVKAPMTFEPFL